MLVTNKYPREIGFMKNIDIYRHATMVGSKWVATPFAINYGYEDHGYEDEYLDYEMNGESVYWYNIFGKKKSEVMKDIVNFAKPDSYGLSICLGDFRDALFGASVKEYNNIHIYLDKDTVYVAGSWLGNVKINEAYDDDFIPMYKETFKGQNFPPMLITTEFALFKFTVDFYRYNLYLRLLSDCGRTYILNGNYSQYNNWLRFDEGKDEDSNKFEYFSSIKTYEVNDVLASNIIRIMKMLDYSVEYETEEV